MNTAAALFERHLDLRPLRGRDRGLVRCRFHEDRTGSLSVDVARGLFNCFGCGVRGGVRRFAELVGESSSQAQPRREPKESEWTVAWRAAVREGRAQYGRRGDWLPWLFANGAAQLMTKTATAARRAGTTLGPDHVRTWSLLELAAHVERAALLAEAQLDELLDGGRLHLDARSGR